MTVFVEVELKVVVPATVSPCRFEELPTLPPNTTLPLFDTPVSFWIFKVPEFKVPSTVLLKVTVVPVSE